MDHDALSLLQGTYLFGQLTIEEIGALCVGASTFDVPPGSAVIREGEAGGALYVVLEGCLEALAAQPNGSLRVLGEMRRGEYFGEIALLEDCARTATVRARTPSRVWALEREGFQAFLQRHPLAKDALLAGLKTRIAWSKSRSLRPPREQMVASLRRFFPDIAESTLADIEHEVEWVALPRGTVFIRQGEVADGFYLVHSGLVSVSAVTADGVMGLGECGPGEPVGEMALLSDAARSATVATIRNTELLRFSRAGFDKLVQLHPQSLALFARCVLERMNARLQARLIAPGVRRVAIATAEECAQIAATPNMVLRNLHITQMYYRLSIDLARILGQADANWCTFACHASKTAGASVRREEVPLYAAWRRASGSRLLGPVVSWLLRAAPTALAARFDRVLGAVSASISAGNLRVFAELAPIFTQFIAAFCEETRPRPDKLLALTSSLAAGPTELGGQDLVADALRHYHAAAFEPNDDRRSELILLGNVKIGWHEQSRLQPNIIEAMNAPVALGLGGRQKDQGRERWSMPAIERSWRRIVTESMMRMRLPYGDLRLGADLGHHRQGRPYADTLETIENPELQRLVERFDRTRRGLHGSAASDWGNLDERMNFILNLFRSRQKSLELFDQPFLSKQRDAIASGVLPTGAL